MHLYTEARAIALEALTETDFDRDAALQYIHETCDGHECVVYYGKAILFCAEQDTSAGEAFLEECGGIAQPGDTFGAIACRIVYATLCDAATACMEELLEEHEAA